MMNTSAAGFCAVLSLALAAACSNNPEASSQAAAHEKAQAVSEEKWRDTIVRSPSPEAGCFQTSYPSDAWEPVDCGPAPTRRYRPAPSRDSP